MKNDLLITLQTHTVSNSPAHKNPRYGCNDRAEITKRSLTSLLKTINNLLEQAGDKIEVRLFVIDDHSDEASVQFIKDNLERCKFETKFIALEETGLMQSIKKCYHELKEHGRELIYFAQDDYLYYEPALFEMVDSYFNFSKLVGQPVSIFPFDEPQEYFGDPQFYRIVNGCNRKWRTNPGGGSCAYLFDVQTLKANWDLYEAFYNHEICYEMEINTINKMISERNHIQFCPLESLAIHFQGGHEKEHFVDWRPLWDANEGQTTYYFPEKTLLHIGCGTQSVKDAFEGYEEIRYDIDDKVNPDIVGDITKLDNFKDKSVDICYSSHVMEHLHIFDVVETIKQMIRISREYVKFVVPNLKYAFEESSLLNTLYVSSAGPITAMDMLFGFTPYTKHNKYMEHKCGFTKHTLEQLLSDFNAEVTEDNYHNLIVTIKV